MPLAHHGDAVGLSSEHTGSRRNALGLAAITLAAFFMSADVTITNVALPSIAAEFAGSMSSLQWVVDSYNIVIAGLLLLGAGLGDRFGRKPVFLIGVSLFATGSLIAGLAGSIGMLIAARTIMGVGGAILLAPALSLIAMMYPPERRTGAIAAWATAGALGLAIGPIAAGLIIASFGWHWVFLMNVPVMACAALLGLGTLPSGKADAVTRLDLAGALLSVIGFACFLGALIEAPSRGWTDPVTLGAFAIGIAGITAFAWWELRSEHPMFQVRVLTHRGVLGASITLFASYVSFTGVMFLLAQQLQVTMGLQSAAIGFAIAPLAVVFWIVSNRATVLRLRFGAMPLLLAGMIAMAVSFAALWLTAQSRSPLAVTAAAMLAAVGWGLIIPIGSVVILNDLPDSLTGSASGTSMLSRFAGASFGIAVLGTVLASAGAANRPHENPIVFAHCVQAAYLAATVLMVALTVAAAYVFRSRTPAAPISA